MTRRGKVRSLSIDEFCAENDIDRPRFWELVGEGLLPPPERVARHETLRVRFYEHTGES
jgi:hypothetical protein